MNAPLPRIIQGGMGVAVSSWRLARAVALRGKLGVVSGTGIDTIVARRLQMGDPGGHLRAAFDAFPVPAIARRVWERHYIEGGKTRGAAYKSKAVPTLKMPKALLDLIVLSNFAEVHLAKTGHNGKVGINLLEKVQLPNLATLYGAMLAGVDYVLMGTGVHTQSIPAVLDHFAAGEPAELPLDVAGALPGEKFVSRFDPRSFLGDAVRPLQRPQFLAIISSSTLALTLVRKSNGRVDGFVVEGPSAGGHNAPPRGAKVLDDKGEPVYGPRDAPDLEQIRALGLPFWLAGSYGDAARLQQALELGASGIQVGTAFAFCDESGLAAELKESVIAASRAGQLAIFTDPHASPTGFPFKVLSVPGTVSDANVFRKPRAYLRPRLPAADLSGVGRQPGLPLSGRAARGLPAQRRHRSRNARSQVPLQRTGSGRRLWPGASQRRTRTCHRDGW